MKTRSKSNNFIAIIIALILFAVGFLLLFIHKQSESNETQGRVKNAATVETGIISEDTDSLFHIARFHTIQIGTNPDLNT